MVTEAEFYLPNDDCANGASCPGEGVFIPQQIGTTDMDAMFVGSDADAQCGLGLANVDSYPLSDEVFPLVYDGAILTLDGLMDSFARKYPERAQLLNALIETQGYRVTFEENPTAAEAELEAWIDDYRELVRRQVIREGDNNRPLLNDMRDTLAQARSRLNAMRHWHFAPGRIYLSTRINRNINKNNYFLGDDEDLIERAPTNEEGADWLNAVMGDWMLKSGIPGASRDEEFSDSFSSRIAWGAMNIVFGAAEVIGGVVLTVGTLGWGTVAGGALSIAGFEAITLGIDMWRTPNQASHATGWLGDGAFAMMNEFGVLDENDQASFNRYWSFAMLGLSLGGSGVLGYAGDVAQASRAGSLGRNFDFVAEAPARALATARQAIVGVRNARFGRLTVSFAPLPSGRIAMNIDGVGRVVAPHWESLTRLRLRMNTTAREFVQERAAKIGAGEAGLVALRGGVSGLASARELVYQVGAHMGLSQRMTDRLISGITLGAPGQTSAFNRARNLRVAADIGLARWLIRLGRRQPMSQYNEFIAMNEIFHELVHAQRLQQWLRAGKTEARYWLDMPQGSSAYAAEEVIVETAAQNWTKRIVEPRIAQELQYGSASNGRYLQQMLDEMIEDSNLYIDHYRTLSRQ